ncbi:hypothetical protein DIPPA_13847 [Diplonema papillatum]|nr:hypothetical protein DIPPA_13847 [Diplonema papillatum]
MKASGGPNMSEGKLLCTDDLQHVTRWFFDADNGFLRINRWFKNSVETVGEESRAAQWLQAKCDYTNRGKIGPADFAQMHAEAQDGLDKRREKLDANLPYAGQCAFGIGSGFAAARVARTALNHKFKVLVGGFLAYQAAHVLRAEDLPGGSAEAQHAKERLGSALQKSEAQLAQFSGRLPERADVADALDMVGLNIVNRKLGPGGCPEGSSLYATLAFGFWWGFRVL